MRETEKPRYMVQVFLPSGAVESFEAEDYEVIASGGLTGYLTVRDGGLDIAAFASGYWTRVLASPLVQSPA